MDIRKKLKLLPAGPGVYRFFSGAGSIIYIGKAKNLAKRVSSYFSSSAKNDSRIKSLVSEIDDAEWIVTNTEVEALILEDKLIKTHKPKYNIQRRDDNCYLYFSLSVRDKYPRLSLVRKVKKDGSLYFGPYIGANQARSTWRAIKKFFPLRQCKKNPDGGKISRPCLNYQLKRCPAPCAGFISPEEYGLAVKQAARLLKGNYEGLIVLLKKRMKKKAGELKFEEAAALRDQIEAARHTLRKQRIVSAQKIDQDVLALARSGPCAGAQVLFIRRGILISDDFFFFKKAAQYDDAEIIRFALSRLYMGPDKIVPRRLVLPFACEHSRIMEEYFRAHKNGAPRIIHPRRGDKKSLLEMAEKNAEQNLSVEILKSEAGREILKETKRVLELKNIPRRVECFDISNISGSDNAGAMAVWQDNAPLKSAYRKYSVKTIRGANDYAAMEEVLDRRCRKLTDGGEPWPDMILIDGGKGQLSAAERALKNKGADLEKTDLIALAKGRAEKRGDAAFPGISEAKEDDCEYATKPGRKNPIRLKKNSPALHFLQNIRDEAHRFAVAHHRRLRAKRGVSSELDDIPGIGPAKRKILLKAFSGLNGVKKADFESLKSLVGISEKDALNIVRHFEKS